jgi:glycosyltransferase involved in cell wall biosynthesis
VKAGVAAPLLVVIPAWNEATTLRGLVAETSAAAPGATIVVVDDASTDETPALLPTLGVRWLRMPARVGTGAATRTGLRYGLDLGLDTAVRVDGDGQHRPDDITRLVAPIEAGLADAVQGTRYGNAPGYRTPRLLRAGHRVLGAALSVATRRRVTDPTSGFWAFGPRTTRLLAQQHPSGYPEPELLLLLYAHGFRVAEVGVRMRPRIAGRTSLTGPRLGVALARVVLGTALARLRAAPRAPQP